MEVRSAVFLVLIICSANGLKKCRVTIDTTLTCKNASPEDFPNVRNDKITWVLLKDSNVPILKKEMLRHYPSLTDVHAENNGLEKIEEDAFEESKVLDWVDVSNNKLTAISSNIFANCPLIQYFNVSGNPNLKLPKNKPFVKARSLEWLDLKQTNLKTVYPETFAEVPKLKVLSLADNALTTLPPKVFDNLNNLYSLDLSNNQFSFLPATLFQPLTHASLYLSGNPWECDCKLVPFVKWVKKQSLRDAVECSEPKNKKWTELTEMSCPPEIAIY